MKLTPELINLLREIVSKRNTELLWAVELVDSGVIAEEYSGELRHLAMDEFIETGLEKDFEPNARGFMLEQVIHVLSDMQIEVYKKETEDWLNQLIQESEDDGIVVERIANSIENIDVDSKTIVRIVLEKWMRGKDSSKAYLALHLAGRLRSRKLRPAVADLCWDIKSGKSLISKDLLPECQEILRKLRELH